MKSLPFKAAIVGAAALTAAMSLPAPAFAIDQVTEGCVQGNPHGYVYLANADHTQWYCFANEGKLTGLDLRDITYIDAGNNELTFWAIDSPDYPFEMAINIQKGTVLERDDEEPILQITAIEIHETFPGDSPGAGDWRPCPAGKDEGHVTSWPFTLDGDALRYGVWGPCRDSPDRRVRW